jgi:YD repeat-containing protein
LSGQLGDGRSPIEVDLVQVQGLNLNADGYQQAPTTSTDPAPGTYSDPVTVILTATDHVDPSPIIYFTVDGSDPTITSTVYTSPITLEDSTTLKFFAVDRVGNASRVQTAAYTIQLPDEDGDGVPDDVDSCPGTPYGNPVDAGGCGASQLDDDNDGVTNDLDHCPGTPPGDPVDAGGCGASQLDDDNDGLTNDLDQCPGTPRGEPVDENGCPLSQLDSDRDGLPDPWEMEHFGSLARGPADDPDRDRLTNLQEYGQGTDPNDPYNGEGPETLRIEYDALGRLKKITDPDGNYVEYLYDPSGNLIKKVVHRQK